MPELSETLPTYTVIAYNYATASENRIHSDDVAAQFGFTGGLVPGVGDYAYLTRPAVEALGLDWLRHGAMSAKFLKPVYDGETVCASAAVAIADPPTLNLELRNAAAEICAVGAASAGHDLPAPAREEWPDQPLPEVKYQPTIAALTSGLKLGSLRAQYRRSEMSAGFVADMRDQLAVYHGADAVAHPAHLPAAANEMLMLNVALGPWIHTASETWHYSLPQEGEELVMCGRIAEAYERRGHEIVVMDLAMFADDTRPVARIRHTAIVHLRQA